MNGNLPDPEYRGKQMSPYEIDKYTLKHYGPKGRIPENTVRSLMDEDREARTKELQSTINFLKQQVEEKKYIDVGSDTEYYMPGAISRVKWMLQLKQWKMKDIKFMEEELIK